MHKVNNDILVIMDYNEQGSKVQNSVDDIKIIPGGQRFNAFAKTNTKKPLKYVANIYTCMVWYGNVLFDIIECAMPENRL